MKTQMSTSGGVRLLLATALGASLVAGCSSSSTGSNSTAASGSPSTAGGVSAAAVKTLLAYTGGTAGVAKGAPITFGFIDSEGGTNSFPEYTSGLNAAAKVLNNQLGGLAGHPIKLVACHVADSDEQGQSCAQKFLADNSIVGIIQGAVEAGDASFHSTLAGKIPVLGVNPTDIADATAKNSYYIEGGQFAATSLITYVSKVLKAKSASVLSASGNPAAVSIANIMTGGMSAAGVKVRSAQYSPTGTDYLAPVQAAGSGTSDVVVPLIISPQQCIAFANAVKQSAIKTPVVTLSACLGPSITKALGDYPKWTYLDFTVNPDAKDPNQSVNDQVAAFKSYVPTITGVNERPGIDVQTLQAVMTLAKAVGTTVPTRSSLGATLKAYTGPVFLGSPSVAFGANPALPAIGTFSVRFYNYDGKGAWSDKTAGQWIAAPALKR